MASLDGGPDGADSKPSPATDRQPDGSPGITEQQEAGQETTSRASAPSTAREEARDEDEDDRSLARIHSVAIPLPRIKIKYCTQCRWMLRAAYFAQELLSTFSTDLGEVALVPGVGGVFAIELFHSSEALPAATPAALGASAAPSTASDGDGRPREKGGHTDESSYGSGSSAADQQRARVKRHLLWDRKRDGGFPEAKELKRRLRDVIQPGKSLGHVDRDYNKPAQDKILAIEQDAPRKKDRGDTDPASLVAAAQTMPNSEAPRVDCTDCN